MATFTKYEPNFLSLIYNHNLGPQDNIIHQSSSETLKAQLLRQQNEGTTVAII